MANKKKQPVEPKSSKKIKGGGEKVGKQTEQIIEGEIINSDNKLNNIKQATTLEGKNLSISAPGQIRNMQTEGMVSIDEEWLPKLLNLEGAGKKYNKIGDCELKFIVNILKYNNNIIAYKEAYDCTNLSIEYIENRSRQLKARQDVAELLNILRARMVRQTEKQLQWQFSQSVDALKYLIDTAMEEVQNARDSGKQSYLTMTRVTAIKDAVKELNQMMGYTEKSVKINNSVTIVGKEDDLPD